MLQCIELKNYTINEVSKATRISFNINDRCIELLIYIINKSLLLFLVCLYNDAVNQKISNNRAFFS